MINIKKPILIKDLGKIYHTNLSGQKRKYGIYKCYCGEQFKCLSTNINNGNTKSCGCIKKVHGMRSHRLYGTWRQMNERCNNKNHSAYKNYGKKGIKVCDEWIDIENFIQDMYPAFEEGLSLDRIDNNQGYSKDNCRWVTQSIQSRNTRIIRSSNTSGYRGVSYSSRSKKWRCTIRAYGKQIELGMHETKLDAAKAYDNYVIENNLEHTINGV